MNDNLFKDWIQSLNFNFVLFLKIFEHRNLASGISVSIPNNFVKEHPMINHLQFFNIGCEHLGFIINKHKLECGIRPVGSL